MKSQKNEFNKSIPRSTKGGGDCPFHAALGSWNSLTQQFETSNIIEKRKKVAETIRTCEPNSVLFPLIKTAIMDLVMRGKNIKGEAYNALKKAYEQSFKEDEELNKKTWENFEKKLGKYSDIMNAINSFTNTYIEEQGSSLNNPEKLRDNLRTQFDTYENARNKEEAQQTLRGLILSLPKLDQAYLRYKTPTQRVSFDSIFNSELLPKLLHEYAEFFSIPGEWLLPCELSIIAYVFEIGIDYYVTETANVEYLNSAKSNRISVCFKQNSHFERMASNQEIKCAMEQEFIEAPIDNNIKKIEFLLSTDIDVNAKSNDGLEATALHWAVYKNRKDIIVILLSHGADTKQVTFDGKTALDWAKDKLDKKSLEEIASLFNSNTLQNEVARDCEMQKQEKIWQDKVHDLKSLFNLYSSLKSFLEKDKNDTQVLRTDIHTLLMQIAESFYHLKWDVKNATYIRNIYGKMNYKNGQKNDSYIDFEKFSFLCKFYDDRISRELSEVIVCNFNEILTDFESLTDSILFVLRRELFDKQVKNNSPTVTYCTDIIKELYEKHTKLSKPANLRLLLSLIDIYYDLHFVQKICQPDLINVLKQINVENRPIEWRYTIARVLTIIGEASKNFSDTFKNKYQYLPITASAKIRDDIGHAHNKYITKATEEVMQLLREIADNGIRELQTELQLIHNYIITFTQRLSDNESAISVINDYKKAVDKLLTKDLVKLTKETNNGIRELQTELQFIHNYVITFTQKLSDNESAISVIDNYEKAVDKLLTKDLTIPEANQF